MVQNCQQAFPITDLCTIHVFVALNLIHPVSSTLPTSPFDYHRGLNSKQEETRLHSPGQSFKVCKVYVYVFVGVNKQARVWLLFINSIFKFQTCVLINSELNLQYVRDK